MFPDGNDLSIVGVWIFFSNWLTYSPGKEFYISRVIAGRQEVVRYKMHVEDQDRQKSLVDTLLLLHLFIREIT